MCIQPRDFGVTSLMRNDDRLAAAGGIIQGDMRASPFGRFADEVGARRRDSSEAIPVRGLNLAATDVRGASRGCGCFLV